MKTTPSLIKLIVFIVVTVLATGTLAATIGNFRFGGTAHLGNAGQGFLVDNVTLASS